MAINQKQVLSLQQKLSPQQIQMIKLLELPTVQLEQRIKQEIEDNIVLEEEEHASEEEEQPQQISVDEYLREDDTPSYKSRINNYSKDDKQRPVFLTEGRSLPEYLLEQLGFRNLSERDMRLAAYLVGSIDEDGYLRRDLESVADDIAFTLGIETSAEELERLLGVLHELEPAGIGARNLRFRSRVWLRAGRPVEWAEIDAPKRREQVAKMTTDAQRKAAEITDAAQTKAQEITDEAEVHRTKTMSQVSAEVEQIRSDIAAQQEDATKKVSELLESLEQRRAEAKKEADELISQAKTMRQDADEYATRKRTDTDAKVDVMLKNAQDEVERQIDERRKAAQEEIDDLKERISGLQQREAQITQRVGELRSMFSNAFAGFLAGDDMDAAAAAPAQAQPEEPAQGAGEAPNAGSGNESDESGEPGEAGETDNAVEAGDGNQE